MKACVRSGALLLTILIVSCASKADQSLACLSPEGGGTLVFRVKNELQDQLRVSKGKTEIGCCSGDDFTLEIVDEDGSPLKRCGFADSFGLLTKMTLDPGMETIYRYSAEELSFLYCGVDLNGAHAQITYGMKAEPGKEYFSVRSTISSKCNSRNAP